MTRLADQLRELSARVDRNVIGRHNPEAFHIEKDDIAKALKRLAEREDQKCSATTNAP